MYVYIYTNILYLDTHTYIYIHITQLLSLALKQFNIFFHPQKFPPGAGKNTNGCQVRTWPEFAALRDIMFFWKYFLWCSALGILTDHFLTLLCCRWKKRYQIFVSWKFEFWGWCWCRYFVDCWWLRHRSASVSWHQQLVASGSSEVWRSNKKKTMHRSPTDTPAASPMEILVNLRWSEIFLGSKKTFMVWQPPWGPVFELGLLVFGFYVCYTRTEKSIMI